MANKTKIICTLGPAVLGDEKVEALAVAGMNVARINFSHGSYEEHGAVMESVKRVRKKLGIPLAIMLDTKGPEVRLGKLKEGGILLEKGQRWQLVEEELIGDKEKVSIRPGIILKELTVGSEVLFDDGYISAEVLEAREGVATVQIKNSGKIISGKGVNFPYTSLKLPSMTEKDRCDIAFGVEQDIDIIAASFIRSADDVLMIKNFLAEKGKPEIVVIAKIENHEGVENFESILHVADGIMIARGDLGVEVPLTEIPKLQKMMIRKCYHAGKPAVTATQMLESMIQNPRPTRAEASDVANAIYDSTSAVMLSGETAVGSYPTEVVTIMHSLIEVAENDFDYQNFFQHYAPLAYHDVPSAVTLSAVKTAYSSHARAIFAFTNSGSTARLLSRLRPQLPILAMTSKEKCYHQLALNWGVTPILTREYSNVEEAFEELSKRALEQGLVNYGDLVVVVAGAPFGISGTTNMMMVESIGDVLVRGSVGLGNLAYGNAILIHSLDGFFPYRAKDRLVVISKCDESYLPVLRACSGIILQNHVDDVDSEAFAKEQAKRLGKPLIVRADGAFHTLHDDQLVTIDPQQGLVYKGVVLNR